MDPICLSNLENNAIEMYGKEEGIEFTQNSVPFDFNGDILLWMDYQAKGLREIFTFDFTSKKKELILSFTEKEGIISHCKLMGTRANLKIAYVKDTQKIYYYDPKKNTTTFVGKVKDAVVALHC